MHFMNPEYGFLLEKIILISAYKSYLGRLGALFAKNKLNEIFA